jgi:hypothetical protein
MSYLSSPGVTCWCNCRNPCANCKIRFVTAFCVLALRGKGGDLASLGGGDGAFNIRNRGRNYPAILRSFREGIGWLGWAVDSFREGIGWLGWAVDSFREGIGWLGWAVDSFREGIGWLGWAVDSFREGLRRIHHVDCLAQIR